MNVTNTLIGDGETPPPGEATPNVPTGPEDIPDRRTGTPLPAFEGMTDEELEGMFDLFGYGMPLYGILGTGDAIPAWVWGCACGGILALLLAIFLGKRRERTHRT